MKRSREQATHAVETYVKAVYCRSERGVAVTAAALAAEIGATAASAAAMLVSSQTASEQFIRRIVSKLGDEVRLGDRVEILSREPLGGPLAVRVGEPEKARILGLRVELAAVLSIAVGR
jgi:Fe2+ transport system protein FeoA